MVVALAVPRLLYQHITFMKECVSKAGSCSSTPKLAKLNQKSNDTWNELVSFAVYALRFFLETSGFERARKRAARFEVPFS